MPFIYDLGVWTEREGGDWEACVISSYLEGLVFGGVVKFPLGIFTQAERETLEKVPDEPQDYATTDGMAKARYGVQLRKLSTGTLTDALAKVGMGYVLAGKGGLNIATAAPLHSVFLEVTSRLSCLVYDPLAPNQSAGVPTATARVLAWAKGTGPNDAREVRKGEFSPADPPKLYTQGELDAAVTKGKQEVAAAAVTEAAKPVSGAGK